MLIMKRELSDLDPICNGCLADDMEPPEPPPMMEPRSSPEKVCTHSVARATPMWNVNDSFVISFMYSCRCECTVSGAHSTEVLTNCLHRCRNSCRTSPLSVTVSSRETFRSMR